MSMFVGSAKLIFNTIFKFLQMTIVSLKHLAFSLHTLKKPTDICCMDCPLSCDAMDC